MSDGTLVVQALPSMARDNLDINAHGYAKKKYTDIANEKLIDTNVCNPLVPCPRVFGLDLHYKHTLSLMQGSR